MAMAMAGGEDRALPLSLSNGKAEDDDRVSEDCGGGEI